MNYSVKNDIKLYNEEEFEEEYCHDIEDWEPCEIFLDDEIFEDPDTKNAMQIWDDNYFLKNVLMLGKHDYCLN